MASQYEIRMLERSNSDPRQLRIARIFAAARVGRRDEAASRIY